MRSANGFPFTKVEGAGNDFIIVDNRQRQLTRVLKPLARRLCDRRRSIGADGLLVAERSQRGDVRMRIFNPDGSEPAMCGNGARCFALHAYRAGWTRRAMRLETGAGLLEARVVKRNHVVVRMMRPRRFARHTLAIDGRQLQVATVVVGVPHAVVVVNDLARINVSRLGRRIRHHRRYGARGTNVDFVQPMRRVVRLRTYERGVEGETLACGTGAVACALVLWKYHERRSPMTMVTRGGARLTIRIVHTGRRIRQVWLTGSARILRQGSFRSPR